MESSSASSSSASFLVTRAKDAERRFAWPCQCSKSREKSAFTDSYPWLHIVSKSLVFLRHHTFAKPPCHTAPAQNHGNQRKSIRSIRLQLQSAKCFGSEFWIEELKGFMEPIMPAIPLMAPPTPPGHFATPWVTGQNASNHCWNIQNLNCFARQRNKSSWRF